MYLTFLESKDKTKKVHKSYCRHWGSEFHNYSVTWTASGYPFGPEKMQF